MTFEISDTICSDCKTLLSVDILFKLPRVPCPECGSTRRTVNAEITESVTVREGLGMKARRPGGKRPYVEAKSMPSQSHRLNKLVHRETLIDRDKDVYRETVTDYESGEVIHHQAEPLSEHVGHGLAKVKKTGI